VDLEVVVNPTVEGDQDSCTAGTPKTPTTASPMNFSTVPPCDSMALRARAAYEFRMRSTSSGSAASVMAVKLTRSQIRVLTTLRSSAISGGDAREAAHLGQKAKSSGASKPQEGQAIMT
jgi:hypothetical protein